LRGKLSQIAPSKPPGLSSYRNSTGAVKLYDSYDNMNFTGWNDTVFNIYSEQQKEFMGEKDTDDEQMYYRATVFNSDFEYHYVNKDTLTEDEKLIWSHYLKNYPIHMPEFSGIGVTTRK
jgi:hypothetical protein